MPNEITASDSQALDAEAFRNVMSHFASGVTIITTRDRDALFGTTASAITSLSLEPPMMIVCLNRSSSTGAAIHRVQRFGVNILGEDQIELAARFATKESDKFAGVPLVPGAGVPWLDGALAAIECTVDEEVRGGTHTVFIAEVVRATATAGSPLAYFRGTFGRLHMDTDQQLRATVRELVLSGQLPPGDLIDTARLAVALGAAPSALYHALTSLAGEGLLARQEDGAFSVAPATAEHAKDVFEAIFAIWLGAAQLTIDVVSPEQRQVIRDRLEALRPRPGDPGWSVERFLEARDQLLQTFIDLADSRALAAAWLRVDLPALVSARWTASAMPSREDFEAMYRGFSAVVNAYCDGDVASVVRALRALRSLARTVIDTSYGVQARG